MIDVIQQLLVRTSATLIATLTTVVIITERQRRITNAKIELAARYIETIEADCISSDPGKEVIKDIKIAEEMMRDVAWTRVARASKIEKALQISRKLSHVRKKYQRLRESADVNARAEAIRNEIEEKKVHDLAPGVHEINV